MSTTKKTKSQMILLNATQVDPKAEEFLEFFSIA